jgi:hypothetical protein
MFRRLAAFVAIALVAPTGAIAGPYEDGVAALSHGDFPTALRLWRPLAERGDALAETQMGILYLNGRGVMRDAALALEWLNRAAAQGEPNAEFNLGVMYHEGTGVPRDDSQSDRW